MWKLIPDTFGFFEINENAEIRNVKTNKILKRQKTGRVQTFFHGKRFQFKAFELQDKLFGDGSKIFGTRVPVTITDGVQSYDFKSLLAAADFLTDEVFYSVPTIIGRLCRREPIIYGWTVKYKR